MQYISDISTTQKVCIGSLVMFSFIFLICSCEKDRLEEKQLNVLWRIQAENELWYRDGIMYDHHYLVFSTDSTGKPLLEAFDIPSRSKSWAFDMTGATGWGGEMHIVHDTLYFESLTRGFTVFELSGRQIVQSVEYKNNPLVGYSSSPARFFREKMYKATGFDPGDQSVIRSYNRDGSSKDVFAWTGSGDQSAALTTPIVFFNEEQGRDHLLMTVKELQQGPNLILFVNGNQDSTVNWIDTLDAEGTVDLPGYMPVRSKDDVIVGFDQSLFSIDMHTGARNWNQSFHGKPITDLVKRDRYVYVYFKMGFAKIDPSNGRVLWTQGKTTPPKFGDFTVHRNTIVYCEKNHSDPIGLNQSTGTQYDLVNPDVRDISNPKKYEYEQFLIAHTIHNAIIAFEIRP